jgi:hypothetical protein
MDLVVDFPANKRILKVIKLELSAIHPAGKLLFLRR